MTWKAGDLFTAEQANALEAVAARPMSAVVTEEVTEGVKDGSNTTFATTYSIVKGTLALFRNGLHQIEGNCYCEIDDNPRLFKTATPPQSNDVLTVIYRTADEVDVRGEVEVLPGTDRGVPINGTRQIKKATINVDRFTPDAVAELTEQASQEACERVADDLEPPIDLVTLFENSLA